MQQNDKVVSSWLNGIDCVDGMDNPAGPLFIQGTAATEAAMADPSNIVSVSTASCLPGGGCHCC